MRYRFVVASYTDALHIVEFDPSEEPDKALRHVSSTEVGHHPSWVEGHPSDETLLLSGLEQADGQLLALRLDPRSGELEVIDKIFSEGKDPCHIFVLENQVIVGNYTSATVSVFGLGRSDIGGVKLAASQPTIGFSGSGPVTERQKDSHPHQVYGVKTSGDASVSELIVPDLGADKLWILSQSANGRWDKTTEIVLDQKYRGGGPRHVVLKDSKLYVLLELSSEIVVMSYDPSSASPATVIADAKLPMPSDLAPLTMLAAELLCPEANPRFPKTLFYASNRNDPRPHGDIISIFAEHRTGQKELECVGQVVTGLNHVRAFNFFGPDERYMIAGGTDGGGMKIFERLNGGIDMREVAHLPVVDGGAGLAPTGFLCRQIFS